MKIKGIRFPSGKRRGRWIDSAGPALLAGEGAPAAAAPGPKRPLPVCGSRCAAPGRAGLRTHREPGRAADTPGPGTESRGQQGRAERAGNARAVRAPGAAFAGSRGSQANRASAPFPSFNKSALQIAGFAVKKPTSPPPPRPFKVSKESVSFFLLQFYSTNNKCCTFHELSE